MMSITHQAAVHPRARGPAPLRRAYRARGQVAIVRLLPSGQGTVTVEEAAMMRWITAMRSKSANIRFRKSVMTIAPICVRS